ncbi:MAG: hypothetical protein LBV67_05625 [Streptococcaceae bacterium]|jgi:hypothetical protein|nr:hypothetical protein [Streptococcaceae bacterium]
MLKKQLLKFSLFLFSSLTVLMLTLAANHITYASEVKNSSIEDSVEQVQKSISSDSIQSLPEIVEVIEEGQQPLYPKGRNATGYHVRRIDTLGTKTQFNKRLRTLKTSPVWYNHPSSIRPKIEVAIRESYAFGISVPNDLGATVSANITFTAGTSYSAQPEARGWRVSIDVTASRIDTKRLKIYYYSNATGRLSHTQIVNRVEVGHKFMSKRDHR